MITLKQPKTLAIDAAIIAFCALWLFLPVSYGTASLSGLFLPVQFAAMTASSPASILLYLVYLVPAYAVFIAVAAILGDRMGPFGQEGDAFQSILRIVVSGIMIYAALLPVLMFADRASWFSHIPAVSWVLFILALAGNVASVIFALKRSNYRNPVYIEYKEFRKEQARNLPAVKDPEKEPAKISALEVLFRIRTKLFFAFIGIISVILLVLTSILLGNYRTSIIKAVGDGAKSQVQQASANYRINLGDSVAMNEYITRQIELNQKAEFKYDNLTLFSNLTTNVYLDALPASMPDYAAEYSTRTQGAQRPDVPPLAGALALSLVKDYAANKSVVMLHDGNARTYSYYSPIVKIDTIRKGDEKIKRERLLGFSAMVFDEDTIMRPYFMTRASVVVYTALFLYIAIVLTYIVGNYIVNPLLFLRMNVRKISDTLTTMINSPARVSAATLVYNDCITSRDEIKSLSTEINEMVTVIRGIVPYISKATLKQAESGVASSTQKELTFLFTDIRGFTTLCEGMKPDEVVGVLNRYLDLETEIIMNNHGDVDKFVGDEMMAFFEGENKEENACRAAMQIRHAMMDEKEKREAAGLPVVTIGIGINTGNVVFGSVGARDRMDFTSIGDTVNLAARLEGANKAYGSKSIITEAVYQKVKEHFLCRELDFIAVKGKNEPVRIFEILQEIPKVQPKLERIKNTFEAGLTAYRSREWEKANASFRANVKEFNDAPSQAYIERVEHFQNNPPPDDWDGVFRMTVK
jgi:class 3 adenylate cyclase